MYSDVFAVAFVWPCLYQLLVIGNQFQLKKASNANLY